jgi:hypothetical protein
MGRHREHHGARGEKKAAAEGVHVGEQQDGGFCGLTFELTPTAEVGRLARAVQHKPARRAGKTACRSGSGAERGVRHHSRASITTG